ncbi:YbhB/YbcL family Raf kinase inhibitor-like protein [Rubrivirga sp. S365]|uniref:YbhB/YbcL family Raf kinase inhibitor-like protein n=1 Tax=Rubrivirga litoralis TaxID=3075598 RepID=A0ABU3BP40_9BACT|nr:MULTISPECIES: YbhB/YbcL family Raf kinase inhibitor-like protein [unclassified Rubrivirga]MDT0631065.1 YbhB/YbcL family Raf kinase inhibitor-like protein [Rubrivirga sp. F394]MDT7855423.1 YbhB/YbcL family Raf kinase inhibitor-like protein [Rubrivirga sp. S365]
MTLTSTSLTDGAPIDPQYAFCKAAASGHTEPGGDRSPHLAWSGAPDGTRSFAVVVRDPDVPADASDANQEGKTIPVDAERTPFYHWLLVDIPASTTEIAEGAASDGVTPNGKAPGRTSLGLAGTNTFTDFLAGSDMEGTYGGYDGPCPPWNDERLHHYHFTVYALDTESLGLGDDGDFTGDDVEAALDGHVLAQAEIVGTYTTNPAVG